MTEITYLMGSDAGGSGFYTDAAAYFSGRGDSPPVAPSGGGTQTLDDVLTDLRRHATAGESVTVVNLVSEPTAPSSLSFPISAAHAGNLTEATLDAALSNAGAAGYPAILGPPAVSKDTTLCLYGPDVGGDSALVTKLGLIFGPELTVYAPLQPQDFQGGQPLAVDDESQFRKTIISSQLAPPDQPLSPPEPEEPAMTQLYGKYRATVVDANDPMSNGRLQVDIPGTGVTDAWAEACLPPIPASLVQLPPTGASVWVEFEQGESDKPLWTGVRWGTDLGTDVTLATAGTLTLRANAVEVQADENVAVSAGMNANVTAGAAASLSAGTTLDLNASAKVDVTAGATLDVSSATSNFSGIVEATTLIASGGVVSPSYTPGAGNVW